MNKRDAKKWACDMAAALLHSDLQTGGVIEEGDPDRDAKRKAMAELIQELEQRGKQ